MNRLDLVFPPDEPAEVSEPTSFSVEPVRLESGEAAEFGEGGTALMTRTVKPGISIRRLRNHRSAWHRRS